MIFLIQKRILEKTSSMSLIYSNINKTEKNYQKALKKSQAMLPNKSYISGSFDFNF
jgi:hypothetical protein